MMISPPSASALVLLGALVLFVSEKVRHDLVALLALGACLLLGLVKPGAALTGFADPAVLAVAAVLVIGRAVELSGVAAAVARAAVPERAGFVARLVGLLVIAALLSAFMNNIAALVITMPIATEIARSHKMPPGATLMPLAFATILGGMTTLIGTPANLILSSVRESELGAPFGFFAMSEVGGVVTLAGLAYLALIGWRLLPVRENLADRARPPWRVFELSLPQGSDAQSRSALHRALGKASARLLSQFRDGMQVRSGNEVAVLPGDRVLIMSRQNQWVTAESTGMVSDTPQAASNDAVSARAAVAHGSFLIGLGYAAVAERTQGRVTVAAAGPGAARSREPLSRRLIAAGDQLFLRGRPLDIAELVPKARLLEIDRLDPAPVNRRRAAAILAIFAGSIALIVAGLLNPALAFAAAAITIAGLRLLPSDEIYAAIDWPVIVLLAAMIPVGRSFETSGAAAMAANMLGTALAGMPLFAVIAAICAATLLLSIFLNNIATAIIMGPLAIDAGRLLGVPADAALLAVLIGASSDFLTPIGHQNNLLVMGPGGYRFSDYARMGAILVLIVVLLTATMLSLRFG